MNSISIFVGKDLFSKYESKLFKYANRNNRANSPQVLSPNNGLSNIVTKRDYVIEN